MIAFAIDLDIEPALTVHERSVIDRIRPRNCDSVKCTTKDRFSAFAAVDSLLQKKRAALNAKLVEARKPTMKYEKGPGKINIAQPPNKVSKGG
jgi:hypothetical protein